MYVDGLVFGLLDISKRLESPDITAKLRGFTISWSRYGYHDLIIESGNVNKILDKALKLGFKFCLIQAYGHIIWENWFPKHWGRKDFQQALSEWCKKNDFLITGDIIDGNENWFGISDRCFLVNLEYYEKFGKPAFEQLPLEPVEVVKTQCRFEPGLNGAAPIYLEPSDEMETTTPGISGWKFVDESLKNGKAVYSFNGVINSSKLGLYSDAQAHMKTFVNYLKDTACTLGQKDSNNHMTADHKKFLNTINLQTKNATRGVFLWNLESYADVENPPEELKSPISTLYSVAAGFKANRILHTHGFNQNTKVVFFDYSQKALEIKKFLHREWDGEDYPRFVKYIFDKFPSPETFYHLWAGLSPEQVNWDDMNQFWQNEIDTWGGEDLIKDHWCAYKELELSILHCNIVAEPHLLLKEIGNQANSVIWWSNAFFTVSSNWYYTLDQRKKLYDHWLRGLATQNPDIFLYGSDYNNISVNSIQAKKYFEQYSKFGQNYLDPYKLHKCELRF